MTRLESLKHDLEYHVKDITISQKFSDRLDIVLEPNSYDGPCLCIYFNDFGQIEYVDFSDGMQEVCPTVIYEPKEFIQVQQILSITYKYLTKKA